MTSTRARAVAVVAGAAVVGLFALAPFSPASAQLPTITTTSITLPPLTTTTTAAPTTTTTAAPTTTTTAASTTTTTESTTTTSTTTSTTTTTASTTTTSTTTTTTTTTTTPASSLAITAPSDVVLGNVGAGGASPLGPVTMTEAGALVPRSWTVTVSSTDFTTTSGDTIPHANVAYASGDALPGATATALAPGQPTGFAAVPLTTEVVAFAGVGGLAQTSASWSPTIAITIPAGAAAGEYHGTITHSAY